MLIWTPVRRKNAPRLRNIGLPHILFPANNSAAVATVMCQFAPTRPHSNVAEGNFFASAASVNSTPGRTYEDVEE